MGRPLPHRLHVPPHGQRTTSRQRGSYGRNRLLHFDFNSLGRLPKTHRRLGWEHASPRPASIRTAPSSPRPQVLLAGCTDANKEDFMSAAAPRSAACLCRSFLEPGADVQHAACMRPLITGDVRVPLQCCYKCVVPGTRTRRGDINHVLIAKHGATRNPTESWDAAGYPRRCSCPSTAQHCLLHRHQHCAHIPAQLLTSLA